MNVPRKKTWKQRGLSWGWWRGFLVVECSHGHRVALELGSYNVDIDGNVAPAYDCRGAHSCPFHQQIRLLVWEGDESLDEENMGP